MSEKVIKTDDQAMQAIIEYLRETGKADEVDSITRGIVGRRVGEFVGDLYPVMHGGFKETNDWYWTFDTVRWHYTVNDTGVIEEASIEFMVRSGRL